MALPRLDSITLDAPGADPRRPLRYALAGAIDQRFATEMRTREDRGSGAAWIPQPRIVQGFGVVAAPGGVALRILPAEGGAPTAGLEDRRLTAAVDDQGRLGAIRFADAPDARALDEVTQRLLSLVVPVPAEPVGVGARWTVVWILRNLAVQKQTATYTLTARDDARWHVDVSLERVGERQRLGDVEVIALSRHYKGSVVIDPSKLLPVEGALQGDSITQLRTAQGDDLREEEGSVAFIAR